MTLFTDIPTLTTERLTLRGPERRDIDALIAFYATERSEGLGGPVDAPQAWRRFSLQLGHWHINGFGIWSVDLTETGEHIGRVGLWQPPDWPERELSWAMFDGFEGRGYAFEAATAARDYALETLGWDTLVSYIYAENTRSRALAERLGAFHDTGAVGTEPADIVYRHRAGGGA